MKRHSRRTLLLIASPLILALLTMFVVFAREMEDGLSVLVLPLIIGIMCVGLLALAVSLLNAILARHPHLVPTFAFIESLMIAAVVAFHIAENDAEVWMWSLISVPFMAGIGTAVVAVVAIVTAITLKRKGNQVPTAATAAPDTNDS